MSGVFSGCCGAVVLDNFVCSWCGKNCTFDLDWFEDEDENCDTGEVEE